VARQLLDGFELDAPVRLLGVGVAGLIRPSPDEAKSERSPPAQEALTLDG
jgi:hypothetical protein